MHPQQSRSIFRRYQKVCILLALIFLNLPVFAGTLLRPAQASNGDDLLKDIPPIDEHTIDNNACGVASATMILDYYNPQPGYAHAYPDIHTVAQYVKENYLGTNGDELKAGIEAASNSSTLQFGNSLKASELTT